MRTSEVIGRDVELARFVSAHPLYAELARTRLPTLRARNLRRDLADVVEATGARRRGDVLRIATWRLDAGLTASTATTLEAARQALAVHELELAERLAAAAHAAGGGPAAGLLLGQVRYRRNRGPQAEAVLAEAMAAAEGDDDTLALLAMVRADNLFWALGRADDAIALVAERRRATADPVWIDVLDIVELGFQTIRTGQVAATYERAAALLDHPVEYVAVGAGQLAATSLVELGRFAEAIAIAQRSHAVHQALGDVPVLFHPLLHQTMEALALVEGGWLTEGIERATDGYDRSLADGIDRMRAWFATVLGRAALRQGRLAAARVLLREAAPVFERSGQGSLATLGVATAVQAAAAAGDADGARAARRDLDRLAIGAVVGAEIDRGDAAIAAADDDLATAAGHARQGAARSHATGEAVLELACLHDLARYVGPAEAPTSAATLLPPGVVARVEALAAVIEGPLAAARCQHVVAAAQGDRDGLLAAATAFTATGDHVYAAEAGVAALALPRSLAGLGDGDERDANAERLRVAALVALVPEVHTPTLRAFRLAAPRVDHGLRDGELRVARLAAAGRTDRQIADELVLSLRTVGNYLQRAYRKLGIRSRDELPPDL